MIVTSSQVQFAGEFVLFLVAMAGITMLVLRGDAVVHRGAARGILVAGFAALATTSFLHGSLLVADPNSGGLVMARTGGLAALVAGTIWWRAGRDARLLMWVGAALVAAGVVASAAESATAAAILRALGAAAIGAALVWASRRSIIAKIAVSAATTLLLVVLVLSVALSAVVSSAAEDQAVLSLEQVAQSERREVDLVVERTVAQTAIDALQELVGTPDRITEEQTLNRAELHARDTDVAPSPVIERALEDVEEATLRRDDLGLAYLTADKTVIAATDPLRPSLFAPISGSRVVAEAVAPGGRIVQVFGTRVWPLAPVPEGVEYAQVLLGAVREESGSRWLTDEEISTGVLAAVDAGEAVAVVGQR